MPRPPADTVRRIEYVPLDDLKPDPRNSKDHDLPGIIALLRMGVADVVAVIDERTGKLIAGHGRRKALLAMHADAPGTPPPGITVEGDRWLVPVGRGWSSRNNAEARTYLVGLNGLTIAGGWDRSKLLANLEGLSPEHLAGTGFSLSALTALRKEVGKNPPTSADLDDEVQPSAPAKPVTTTGDVWTLGPHLLVCADTWTDAAWANLESMGEPAAFVTDPPYAIYGSATGIAADIADDSMVVPFFETLFRLIFDRLPWFGHAYVFCDWRSWSVVWRGARAGRMDGKNCLVWDKGSAGLGSNYANSHEFIGFFHKLPPSTAMGNRPAGQRPVYHPNILRHNRVTGADREHNAAKPVALLAELITNSTDPGALIVDPFAGSGSTLIAADQVDRRCYAVEQLPAMCDIIAARYERITGNPPALNGTPHPFAEG